jgi:hypothetical protein
MAYYLINSGEENWAYSIEVHEDQAYRVGRAADNDVVVNDRRVSSYHARLQGDGDGFTVHDLNSRNGTEVNGKRTRKAKLAEGDTVSVGRTSLQLVTRLEASHLSRSAILSPRLSQPLLRTEIRKLQDIVGELIRLQDLLVRHDMDEKRMDECGEKLGQVIARLREVEGHTRVLTSMNHFHELFHKPMPPRELYGEALRFLVAALEAEDGAILTGQCVPLETDFSVEATMGMRVVSWQSRVPPVFEALLRQCIREKRSILVKSMKDDARFQDGNGAADGRSILVSPMTSPRGRVIGAAYFDNTAHPGRLNAADVPLVEGCMRILTGYVMGEDSSSGGFPRVDPSETQMLADPDDPANQTLY